MLAPKNGLSEQAQDVVDLFAERQGDYSYKEIAKALGRGESRPNTAEPHGQSRDIPFFTRQL